MLRPITHRLTLTQDQRAALAVAIGDAVLVACHGTTVVARVIRATRMYVPQQNESRVGYLASEQAANWSNIAIANVRRPDIWVFADANGYGTPHAVLRAGQIADSVTETARMNQLAAERGGTRRVYSVFVETRPAPELPPVYARLTITPATMSELMAAPNPPASSTPLNDAYDRIERERTDQRLRASAAAERHRARVAATAERRRARANGAPIDPDAYAETYGCTLAERQARDLDDEEYEEPARRAG